MIKRSTLILVVIFVVVLLFAVLFQRSQGEDEAETTPTTGLSYLIDIGESEIIAMEINSEDGAKVVVKRDTDGSWTLVEPANDAADTLRIEASVSQAGTLRTLSKLGSRIDLVDIGLDQATYRIVMTLSNGEQRMAFIGNVTPIGSGYYAYADGEPVQVVNKFNVDSVLEI